MDRLLRRIIAVLLMLSVVNAYQPLPYDTLESYYQHIMLKANQEFESMIDNWAADYIGMLSDKPIECPGNVTDENGNLMACVLPTEKNIDNNNTVGNVNNEISENVGVTNLGDGSVSDNMPLSVNNTVLHKFYDKMRLFIQDPMLLPDKTKLKHLPNFVVMYWSTKNVKIAGLSEYDIAELNISESTSSIYNQFKWSHVNLSGLYEIDLSGPRIHLYGNGPFSINISDILFGFNIFLGENDNKTLKLDSFEVDLDIGNVSLNLDNFLDGGAAGESVNNFLSEIVPQALSFAMPQFKDILKKKAVQHANNYLCDIYAQNVTNFVKQYIAF